MMKLSKLLQNLSQYQNQMLTIEGYLVVYGTVVVYLKPENSRFKFKFDEQTVLIDLDPNIMKKIMRDAFKYQPYERFMGLRRFPISITGRIEPFASDKCSYIVPDEFFDSDKFSYMFTDVSHISAKVPFRKAWQQSQYKVDFGMSDGFIETEMVTNQFNQVESKRHYKRQYSIAFEENPHYDIDLGKCNESLESAIGQHIALSAEAYIPRGGKPGKDFTLKVKSAKNPDNLRWIWLDPTFYHSAVRLIAEYHLRSPHIPVCEDVKIIGKLAYVPNGETAPIKLEEPTRLMLTELQFIQLTFPISSI